MWNDGQTLLVSRTFRPDWLLISVMCLWSRYKCMFYKEDSSGYDLLVFFYNGLDCNYNAVCVCCLTEGEELWSEADSSCSGQPIHLWQFLRELLLKPHSYGRCIRWLNKDKGE